LFRRTRADHLPGREALIQIGAFVRTAAVLVLLPPPDLPATSAGTFVLHGHGFQIAGRRSIWIRHWISDGPQRGVTAIPEGAIIAKIATIPDGLTVSARPAGSARRARDAEMLRQAGGQDVPGIRVIWILDR
jgi:hypothetical protein